MSAAVEVLELPSKQSGGVVHPDVESLLVGWHVTEVSQPAWGARAAPGGVHDKVSGGGVLQESLKRRQIDELWQARRATAPASLAAALMSQVMLDELRKEIRRTTGHNPEVEQLAEALRTSVIRPEAFDN